MADARSKSIAAGEMEILQLLWGSSGLTLSEAHKAMCQAGREIGYTTVQTRLERMVEKDLVSKSKDRPAVYRAAVEPAAVQTTALHSLLQRVTGAVPLFAQLVQDPSLRADDLQEMRRLIDAAEQRLQDSSPPKQEGQP